MRPIVASRLPRVGATDSIQVEPPPTPARRVWMQSTSEDMYARSDWAYAPTGSLEAGEVLAPGMGFRQKDTVVYRIPSVPDQGYFPVRRPGFPIDDWRTPESVVVAGNVVIPLPAKVDIRLRPLVEGIASVLEPRIALAVTRNLGRPATDVEVEDAVRVLSQALLVLHIAAGKQMSDAGQTDWTPLLNQGFSIFGTPSTVSRTRQGGAWDTLGVIRGLADTIAAAVGDSQTSVGSLISTRLITAAALDGAKPVHVPNVVDALVPLLRPATGAAMLHGAAVALFPGPGARQAERGAEGKGETLRPRAELSSSTPGWVKPVVGGALGLLLIGLVARALRD